MTILLATGNALAQEEPVSKSAPAELLGRWRSESGRCLEFFESRLAQFRDGRLGFHLAHYEDERVDRLTWGHVDSMWWEVSADGSTLHLADAEFGEEEIFTKVEEELAVLRVPRLEFGSEPADEARVAALQEEIARRLVEDQAVRTGGVPDPARMLAVDEDNTAWLIEQVEEIGWIDGARFGAAAAKAAFLIVQHSGDLGLMSTALPAIESDVQAGHAEGQDYALLYDRLEMNLGRPQLYGSQLGGDGEGNLLLMPLARPEEVAELRAGVGLPPLEVYLAYFEGKDRERPVRRLTLDDWFLPR